ncbi:MAG: hypothetical protein KC912_08995 [Proteobacteria bacterium]|nr:hypothetical protein [Pseudomonadota bacterium]
MTLLQLTAILLKRPAEIVDRAEDRAFFASVVPKLIVLVVLGAAVFGAVAGSYRGGVQVLFAAVKLPVLFLVPLIVALPAVRAIAEVSGAPLAWSRLVLAALSGVARTSVIAAALSPGLWLLFSWTYQGRDEVVYNVIGYHSAVLMFAASVLAVGLPLLLTVASALPATGVRKFVAMGASAAVLGATLMQTGWLLRPFVARPTTEVAFLRPVEEDVFSALTWTTFSAAGAYDSQGWEARPSGAFRRTRR